MRQLLAAGLLAAFVGAAAIAQAANKPNPSGTWKLSTEVNGSPMDFTLKLKLDGDKLTGTIVGDEGKEKPIKDGTLKDGSVSFTVNHEQDGQQIPVKITGKLSGKTMKGKATLELDGQAMSLAWEAKLLTAAKAGPAKKAAPAKKDAAAGDPAGTWALTVDVNGSPYEFTLKLKGEAGKLSGTITGDDGQEKPLQDVKFKDGTLTFAVVREQDGEKMLVKNTGKLAGNTMKGKAEIKLGDEPQNFPWEAKRAK